MEGKGSGPPRLPSLGVQEGLIAPVSKETSSENGRAWGGEGGEMVTEWFPGVSASAECHAERELASPRPRALLRLCSRLLPHGAPSLPFGRKAAAAAVFMQGKKKSVGKCLALRAAFTAQTRVPCFLQVSRESGTATAMFLAESSTCTTLRWFAYHQWYTTVWEPLV